MTRWLAQSICDYCLPEMDNHRFTLFYKQPTNLPLNERSLSHSLSLSLSLSEFCLSRILLFLPFFKQFSFNIFAFFSRCLCFILQNIFLDREILENCLSRSSGKEERVCLKGKDAKGC